MDTLKTSECHYFFFLFASSYRVPLPCPLPSPSLPPPFTYASLLPLPNTDPPGYGIVRGGEVHLNVWSPIIWLPPPPAWAAPLRPPSLLPGHFLQLLLTCDGWVWDCSEGWSECRIIFGLRRGSSCHSDYNMKWILWEFTILGSGKEHPRRLLYIWWREMYKYFFHLFIPASVCIGFYSVVVGRLYYKLFLTLSYANV